MGCVCVRACVRARACVCVCVCLRAFHIPRVLYAEVSRKGVDRSLSENP